jgi:hypothetical protein
MSNNLPVLNNIITKQEQIDNLSNQKNQENEANIQEIENDKDKENSAQLETVNKQNNEKDSISGNNNNVKDDISIHVDTYNKDDNLLDNINNLEIPNNMIITTETNIITENKENNNIGPKVESIASNNNIKQTVKNENNKLNDNLKANDKENNKNNENNKNENPTEIKTIKKIKTKKKQKSAYKQNKNININTNQLNNFSGNNNNVSESVYLQYNTLYQNKDFLNKNKNIIKKPPQRNKNHIRHKNKFNSIDTKRSHYDEKFESLYQRFIEDQKKKKEKIIQMQKSQEEH